MIRSSPIVGLPPALKIPSPSMVRLLPGNVAGAVAGGGLTMIANAPNPAGVGMLQDAKAFGGEGISPSGLFLGALVPTAVAIFFFWLLR